VVYFRIMDFPFVAILSGVLLLVLGRRLFWLFVALLGFVSGMALATQLFAIREPGLLFLIAIGCGVIGALVALFLQRLAIGIAGFLAGGMIAVLFSQWIGIHAPVFIPGLIGGFLGAVLLSVLFDWALIFLSSASGASLIVHSISMNSRFVVPAFFVLVIIGIVIQSRFRVPAARTQPHP
jgi:Domain of unknown function (DUF4203)